MGRFILLAVVVVAVVAFVTTLKAARSNPRPQTQEASVPDTVKTISYVLLILVMLGVVTGLFGGL